MLDPERLAARAREIARSTGHRLLLWAVPLAVVLLVVAVPNLPGRWNTDTAVMVEQMRAHSYDDIWAPFITWLWQPFFALGFGAAWLMCAQAVVLTLSIGMILRRGGVSLRWARVWTVLLVLNPIIYAATISVMRDTWFLCALLTAIAIAMGPRTRAHGVQFGIAAVLAVASRQNAIAAVAVVIGWMFVRWWPHSVRWKHYARAAVAALCASAAIVVALSVWSAAVGVKSEHPETALFVGDLDEMSTRVGVNLMPADVVDPPLTMDEFRSSSIYALDTLWFYGRRASLRQPAAIHAEIRSAWRHAVVDHPVVYFHGRWKLFTRQIGWSGPPRIAYFPEYLGGPRSPVPVFPSWAARASGYLAHFTDDGWYGTGGWAHRAWLWWAASGALAAWWVARGRRRWHHDLVPMVFLAITAHLGALMFVAPHAQYRFVEAAIVLAQIALVCGGWQWWSQRRNPVAETATGSTIEAEAATTATHEPASPAMTPAATTSTTADD